MPTQPTAWLIDISNTFTKCATARGRRLGRVRRYPTADWTVARWRRAWRAAGSPRSIVASCVVPAARRTLARALPAAHFLSHQSPCGIPLRYPGTRTLGADRLANAIAAARLHGAPAIAADFGTAATFDVIDAKGAYIGGAIAPGRATLAHALSDKTALLPLIQPDMPRRAIGRGTRDALRSGLAIGFAGLAAAILDALRKELAPANPVVIATGGDAPFARRHVPGIDRLDPRLTLRGLALVAEALATPRPRSRPTRSAAVARTRRESAPAPRRPARSEEGPIRCDRRRRWRRATPG
jgi:type III pantothenate kinase